MADNLTIHQQINALLIQRTKVLNVHNDILKDQLALASTLRDALEGADPEKLVDQIDGFIRSTKQAFNEAGNALVRGKEADVLAAKARFAADNNVDERRFSFFHRNSASLPQPAKFPSPLQTKASTELGNLPGRIHI